MKLKRILAGIAIVLLLMPTVAFATEWVAKITYTAKVYASASKESKYLGKIKSNQIIKLLAVKGSWAQIELDGNVGYINKNYVTKTKVKCYVKSESLTVYASFNTSSKKLGTMFYGEMMYLEATDSGWARVSLNGNVGFCKYSGLSLSNPNTMNLTVYTQEDGVKAYAGPGTDYEELGALNVNSKLTCLAVTADDKWCRVKNGNVIGFIKKSSLATKKCDGVSTAKMASGASVEADWWDSDIQKLFARGDVAIVTDVNTGITFRVYRGGGTNHADVQPYTAADTKALIKACGTDFETWARRAIWVSVDGAKYAASMNCMPHGDGSIQNNDYDGHFCIHFTNSRTHGGNAVCPLHQACVKKALKAG